MGRQSDYPQRGSKSSRFEFRLGFIQLALLVPVLFASVFAAYISGYVSGKKTGFDLARSSAAAHLPGVSVQEAGYADADEAYYEREAKSLEVLLDRLDAQKLADKASQASVALNDGHGLQGLAEREGVWEAMPADGEARARLQQPEVHHEVALLGDTSLETKKREEKKEVLTLAVSVDEKTTDAALQEKAVSVQQEKLEKKQEKVEAKKEETKEAPVLKVVPLDMPVKKPEEKRVEAKVDAYPTERIRAGYYAQAATVNSISEARQLVSRLQASGFRSQLETARVRGVTYYRVLVGPERVRSRAVILVDQLKRESYLRTQPFIKLVNGR